MARYAQAQVSSQQESDFFSETSFDTHDVQIPLPPPKKHPQQRDYFRLILLSATEMESPDTVMERISRLYHQHGGRHVGIVFLLSPGHAGTVAFMNLQARYRSLPSFLHSADTISLLTKVEMPLLPLSAIASLPAVLTAFQRQLVSTRSAASVPLPTAVSALLPYSTTDPPMPEHARNIVTDICPNIPSLARAATTEDGKQGIREYLSDIMSANGGPVAEDIIAFWDQEYVVD